jgi:hypothetical protein
MVDGPVFAARVDSLQDDQQRVFFFGVHQALLMSEFLAVVV